MPRGGKRPGAGKPKGYKHKNTLDREISRKHYEERILKQLDPLIDAQLDVAKGLFVMFAREYEKQKKGPKMRTGRFARVTDPFEIQELLNGKGENGEDYYYVSTKDPDGKVLENLMARVFGKSTETIKHDVSDEVKSALAQFSTILP